MLLLYDVVLRLKCYTSLRFFEELNRKFLKRYRMKIEFIHNEEYTEKIKELRNMAEKETKNTGQSFCSVLQILEHLK